MSELTDRVDKAVAVWPKALVTINGILAETNNERLRKALGEIAGGFSVFVSATQELSSENRTLETQLTDSRAEADALREVQIKFAACVWFLLRVSPAEIAGVCGFLGIERSPDPYVFIENVVLAYRRMKASEVCANGGHCWVSTSVADGDGGMFERCSVCNATRSV